MPDIARKQREVFDRCMGTYEKVGQHTGADTTRSAVLQIGLARKK
jgi:hypothetical protein